MKITYVISGVAKSSNFEWVAQGLQKAGWEQHYFLLQSETETEFSRFLDKQQIQYTFIRLLGKKDFPMAFIKLCFRFMQSKPFILHCHLTEAGLLGLTAGWLCRIKTRVYTRHHSSSNENYAPRAVKYDLFLNRYATQLIAISKNVARHLIRREHVPESKVKLIYHGVAFSESDSVSTQRVEALRIKYQLGSQTPVIGVIARYIHLKGIQYIIPAFQKLLETYPDACLVLANAKGDYTGEIRALLRQIPARNYREIEFESDLFALYRLFQGYVHVPIDEYCEAFGQTYIEALACKIPSVFTLSGIAPEFITDRRNALVVPYCNPERIYTALLELLSTPALCQTITDHGYQDVREKFDIQKTIGDLDHYYHALTDHK